MVLLNYVRCPWAGMNGQNFEIIFHSDSSSSFWITYFFPRRNCSSVLKFCMQVKVKNRLLAAIPFPTNSTSILICLK